MKYQAQSKAEKDNYPVWLIAIPVCWVSFSRGYSNDDDKDDEDDSSDQQEVALPLPQLSLWEEGVM